MISSGLGHVSRGKLHPPRLRRDLRRRRGAHLVRGRIGALQLGEAFLDKRVAAAQGVIFRIRYFRPVIGVIGLVRAGDLRRQPRQFGLGLFGRQLADRHGRGCFCRRFFRRLLRHVVFLSVLRAAKRALNPQTGARGYLSTNCGIRERASSGKGLFVAILRDGPSGLLRMKGAG